LAALTTVGEVSCLSSCGDVWWWDAAATEDARSSLMVVLLLLPHWRPTHWITLVFVRPPKRGHSRGP
jgi:hypothetical protein